MQPFKTQLSVRTSQVVQDDLDRLLLDLRLRRKDLAWRGESINKQTLINALCVFALRLGVDGVADLVSGQVPLLDRLVDGSADPPGSFYRPEGDEVPDDPNPPRRRRSG